MRDDKQLYLDFGKSIRNRLYGDINGRIWFEMYPEIDTIVIKIIFKEFDYHYAIDHVQEHVYNSDEEEIVNDFKKKYKRDVLNAFFKTDERKWKDREDRIFQEAYV